MLHRPVNGETPPANERSEWNTDLTYTHLQGAGGWALAMALHALVRQTTRAKPKLALQWWRDADLTRLFRVDCVPPEAYAATPLFRRSSGACFTTDYVREVVRFLMRSVGLPPSLYGGHSLRIGGASAALAANVSEAVIRAMGRWDSDVYELYLRGSLSCARQMGSVIASTSYEDFEAMFDHEEFVRT